MSDVFFRDSQFFLYAELDRKSVCIPAGFALDTEALQRFVPAKEVFERPGHDVVDARNAIR
jgi:hypothetical protein